MVTSVITFTTSSTSSARMLTLQTKWSIELVSLQFRVFSCITHKKCSFEKVYWLDVYKMCLPSWGCWL
jgi:hypothetical protein